MIHYRLPNPFVTKQSIHPEEIVAIEYVKKKLFGMPTNELAIKLKDGSEIPFPVNPVKEAIPMLHQILNLNPSITVDKTVAVMLYSSSLVDPELALVKFDLRFSRFALPIIVGLTLHRIYLMISQLFGN